LIFGDTKTFVIPRNAPQGTTPPRIDYIAYAIENWERNAVTTELERRGLNPQPDMKLLYGKPTKEFER
jgi:hypothetical protein